MSGVFGVLVTMSKCFFFYLPPVHPEVIDNTSTETSREAIIEK